MEINYDANTKMYGGYPVIRKQGAVSPNCESSPFVWRFEDGERLMRLELYDRSIRTGFAEKSYAIIRDCESGRILSRVGEGCYYFSFYQENGVAYVLCTNAPCGTSSSEIMIFESRDLVNWRGRSLLKRPGWLYYNTSLAKGPDGYMLALEASEPEEAVGPYPYTVFFASSKNLRDWSFLPDELGFSKERYTGAPFMHYSRGWYYLIVGLLLPCERFGSYIFRTKDFKTWETGLYNPIMMPDNDDRKISPEAHDIDDELREKIATAFAVCDSDYDLCDYKGKTVISYNVGNQLGFAYIAQAIYDGSSDDFFEAFFR